MRVSRDKLQSMVIGQYEIGQADAVAMRTTFEDRRTATIACKMGLVAS